jgi:RecA/RadA recombinase
MTLTEKLLKNTTIKGGLTTTLDESELFVNKTFIPTPVPMINVALSGRIDGGLQSGMTILAGPSKHFKTMFALLMASSYMKYYPDSAMLFYVNEFGSPTSYFNSFDIPMDRVVVTPFTDVEQLKQDTLTQIEGFDRKDNVIMVVDSLGNAASKKEIDDTREGKSVADYTRAKSIKSWTRMVTPWLTIKDIPLVVVNHTYKEQTMYPRDIMSGGTGPYYNADNIWIIGRQQDKDGTEIQGYNYVINIEKSRYLKEKSKIPINVTFEGGINKWSGLVDLAMEAGFITKPKAGWYAFAGKNYRLDDIERNDEFWNDVFSDDGLAFKDFIANKYLLSTGENKIIT